MPKVVGRGKPQVGRAPQQQTYPINQRAIARAPQVIPGRNGRDETEPLARPVEAQPPAPKFRTRKIAVGIGKNYEELVVKKGWTPPPTFFRKGLSLILWQLEADEYFDSDESQAGFKAATKKIAATCKEEKLPEREYQLFKCPPLSPEEIEAGETQQKQWRFYRIS